MFNSFCSSFDLWINVGGGIDSVGFVEQQIVYGCRMVNGVLSETFLFGFSLSPAHELASLCIQQTFENYPDIYFLYIGLHHNVDSLKNYVTTSIHLYFRIIYIYIYIYIYPIYNIVCIRIVFKVCWIHKLANSWAGLSEKQKRKVSI